VPRSSLYTNVETKICSKCGPQPISQFSWKNKAKGIRCGECKVCHRQYNRQHYAARKQYYVDKAQRYQDVVYSKSIAYLKEHPCVDCGESDPIVLDYDHRPDSNKTDNISTMIQRGNSWKVILEEISKCDVRCANCHRRITAKRGNWRIVSDIYL